MQKSNFFNGIKVVEIAGVLAGPAAGMFFAELGAEVVKIENKKGGGDPIRKWKLPEEDQSKTSSAYYHSVNWNKQVVMLDFNSSDDLVLLNSYLQEADIALVNFKAGDATKWKLDNKSLRIEYPSLIIGEIKGFRDSERVAYDAVLQAETGFMSMNGTSDTPPLKMPIAFIDLFAGHQLKEGLLIALIHRMKTGKGSLVSVSLEESAIASLANQATAWLNCEVIASRKGSLHPVIAPYGETFMTADMRFILLAVGTDQQFARLCGILEIEGTELNPLYSTNPARVINRKKLKEVLEPEFAKWNSDELMKKLDAAGVPAGAVKDIKEVFETKTGTSLVLDQTESDGTQSKRVSTAIFSIEVNP